MVWIFLHSDEPVRAVNTVNMFLSFCCCFYSAACHSVTHLLLLTFWLSKKSIKLLCAIESTILLISLAMVDSAYLFPTCCSSSLRVDKKTKAPDHTSGAAAHHHFPYRLTCWFFSQFSDLSILVDTILQVWFAFISPTHGVAKAEHFSLLCKVLYLETVFLRVRVRRHFPTTNL